MSIEHYKIQGLKTPHYNKGYIAVTLHKSILLSSLPQTILKVTLGAQFFLLHCPGNLVAD
jgi:hypothetical protein